MTGVQTCALPISSEHGFVFFFDLFLHVEVDVPLEKPWFELDSISVEEIRFGYLAACALRRVGIRSVHGCIVRDRSRELKSELRFGCIKDIRTMSLIRAARATCTSPGDLRADVSPIGLANGPWANHRRAA